MAKRRGEILIIADDAARRAEVASALERAGYRVGAERSAKAGPQADLAVRIVPATLPLRDALSTAANARGTLVVVDGAEPGKMLGLPGLSAMPDSDAGLVALVRDAMARSGERPATAKDRVLHLLDEAQIGVFEIENGRLTYVNDHLVEVAKYSRDELLARDFVEFVAPRDARRMRECLAERTRGIPALRPTTYHFVAKDGEEREVEVLARWVPGDGGGRVEGTLRDVTAASRLARLHHIVLELGGVILAEQDIDRILQLVLDTISEYSGFRRAVLALYDLAAPDPVEGAVTKMLYSGLSPEDEAALAAQPSLTPEKRKLAFSDQYRLGAAYYVPHDRAPWASDVGISGTVSIAGWHPDDMLFIPLRGENGIVGSISVDDPVDQSAPTIEMIDPIARLASFAALAVERVVKWTELRTQNERLHGLSRLGDQIAKIQTVDELCEAAARRVCDDLGHDYTAVWLREGDALVLGGVAVRRSFPHQEVPARGTRIPVEGKGLTRWAVRYMEPAVVDDVAQDGRYQPSRASIRSMAAIPIFGRKGVRGVLDVESRRQAAFGEPDQVALSSMASQLAVALAALSRRDALSRLYAFGQRISESTTVSEIVAIALDFLAEQFSYPLATVFLDGRDGSLFVAGVRGPYSDHGMKEGWAVPPGRGIVSWVARNRRFALVNDVTTDPRYFEALPTTRSEIAIPLLFASKLVGVLNVESPVVSYFDDEDRIVLEVIASQLATALANLDSQASLREQTVRDSLTGLFNRHYFNSIIASELARADRHARPFAVMMIDVDNFRAVNNRFGHLRGDEILRDISRLLVEEVRASDRVIRYGGDEFLVFMPDTSEEEALQVAARLRDQMALLPRRVGVGDIPMGLSVGIYAREPRDKRSLESILEEADRRLYADKRARQVERTDDDRR